MAYGVNQARAMYSEIKAIKSTKMKRTKTGTKPKVLINRELDLLIKERPLAVLMTATFTISKWVLNQEKYDDYELYHA